MFDTLRINFRRLMRGRFRFLVAASRKDLDFWRSQPYLQDFVPIGQSTSELDDSDGGVSVQMIDAEMLMQAKAQNEHFFLVNAAGHKMGQVGYLGDTPFKLLNRLETTSPRYVTHFVQVIYWHGRRGKQVSIVVWQIPRGYASTYHYCLDLVNQAGRSLVERRQSAAQTATA